MVRSRCATRRMMSRLAFDWCPRGGDVRRPVIPKKAAGRPERSLSPEQLPMHAFATRLRALRERAGKPPYADMVKVTGISRATLYEATGGDKLPTWSTVAAIVSYSGADPADYRDDWERLCELRNGMATRYTDLRLS